MVKCAMGCGRLLNGGKGSRDHVLPEGLGQFDKPFITDRICKECNNHYGRILETPLLRQSFFTPIRNMLGIRSAKSKKKTFQDPLKTLRNSGPTKFAELDVTVRGINVKPIFNGVTIAELPTTALIDFQNGIKTSIELIGTPAEMAKQIVNTMNGIKGTVNIYAYNKDDVEAVMTILNGEGFVHEGQPIEISRESRRIVVKCAIDGQLNETHLRAHGYILIKSLLYAGYDPAMLKNLIEFVKGSPPSINACGQFDQVMRDANIQEKTLLEQEDIHHCVGWDVSDTETHGFVGLFANQQMAIVAHFSARHPTRQLVLAPGHIPGNGRIAAAYHNDGNPGHGWCMLIRNGTVEETSRPGSSQ